MRDEFFRRLMGTTLEQFMPRLMVLLGIAIVAFGTAAWFLKRLVGQSRRLPACDRSHS